MNLSEEKRRKGDKILQHISTKKLEVRGGRTCKFSRTFLSVHAFLENCPDNQVFLFFMGKMNVLITDKIDFKPNLTILNTDLKVM